MRPGRRPVDRPAGRGSAWRVRKDAARFKGEAECESAPVPVRRLRGDPLKERHGQPGSVGSGGCVGTRDAP